jgi:twitching motility two-component system response regulator PilH
LARKILLADDSVTAQNMGRRILTDAGYEVVTVNNGSAALKKIAELKPDLIVLDVYMPGYGGLEVCQRMKENKETARVPVLLTVGKLEPFKPDEARRVQADAYIVKPFEASELLTALTKLEDKIVPQPEPYKPGRFAKAIAAVEQIAPDGFGDSDSGWKERLIIPHPAAKQAEPEPEPVVAVKAERELKASLGGFERPCPSGLPADITPEEIAAITAAAAKANAGEQAPTETTVAEPVAAAEIDTPVEHVAQAVGNAVEPEVAEETPATFASATQTEVAAEATSEVASLQEAPAEEAKIDISKVTEVEVAASSSATDRVLTSDAEVLAALASLGSSSDLSAKTGEPVFSTTSAAAELVAAAAKFTGPRWIAESIPVPLDEATFILELEMQKQYAAFAAADAVCAKLAGATSSVVYESPAVAQPAATFSEAASIAIVETAPEPVEEFRAVVESSSEETISEEKGEAFAAAAGASENGGVGLVAAPEVSEASAAEPGEAQRESELAAAWANWKQIRGSIMGSQTVVQISAPIEEVAAVAEPEAMQAEVVQAEPAEIVQAEGAPEIEAAEVSASAVEEAEADGASDISDIVDNMLAELKPKLMKEIAKKLKTDKKR